MKYQQTPFGLNKNRKVTAGSVLWQKRIRCREKFYETRKVGRNFRLSG
jgi:hypothetical protein